MPPLPLPRINHYNDPCDDHPSDCPPLLPPPVPPTPSPPPPSSLSSHGRATFVTALIVAGSVLAALTICLLIFLCVRHRRQWRRRREALLEAAVVETITAAAAADGFGLEEGEGGEVVHHAWHIRTVGLDEAAIESIALTRYRAGGVLGGASDCAVCLGEFSDGELLRLLPNCAHAFHVACIDTWLRAHVNCPLCRARVLDPALAVAVEQGDPPAGIDAGAEQAATSNGATEHEQIDQQASDHGELRLQIDHHDGGQLTSPEQPHRRVASMDSPSPIASAEEAVPEDEQAGGDKQGTGGAVHRRECELSPPGCSDHEKNHRGIKRSLSVGSRWALVSRHCRRSSSLLPL